MMVDPLDLDLLDLLPHRPCEFPELLKLAGSSLSAVIVGVIHEPAVVERLPPAGNI